MISPQFARFCYLATVMAGAGGEPPATGAHTPSCVNHNFKSHKKRAKSRGRGGRKLGKQAHAEHLVRQRRLRRGELRYVCDLLYYPTMLTYV